MTETRKIPLTLDSMDAYMALFGLNDQNVALVEQECGVAVSLRGSELFLTGEAEDAGLAESVILKLLEMIRRGDLVDRTRIRYAIALAREGDVDRIDEILRSVVAITHRGKQIRCKTLGQQEYVQAIRDHDLTFAVGPAGTGKTVGAKAIAAGLGLPYMKYTCSANTEIFDFVGMIFPDSEDASTGNAQLDAERETLKQMGGINYANVSKLMKLPDLDDMDYDPAGVYMALTGVENAAATSQDCMSIVLDRVTEKVRELSKTVKDKNSSGQTYRYVETDFVKALKHGYVIEIQEPSTIVQPGVLVGLNSLLEQSGSITLPTGEVIQRHPDAVVVVTTNTSYEGCRGMNQSVLDRMSLVRDVELPSPEVMAQRAMSVTGATDEYEVSKMVQVVNDLAEYCRKNSITDGSYGMRSLIDWIISSEITGDVYESALYTIISKATADELDREALISTVLEPIFAPKRHKASA